MLALPLFWLRAGAVAAVVIGLVLLVDEIGDRREAIVNARLTAARAADQAAAIERQRQSEKIGA